MCAVIDRRSDSQRRWELFTYKEKPVLRYNDITASVASPFVLWDFGGTSGIYKEGITR